MSVKPLCSADTIDVCLHTMANSLYETPLNGFMVVELIILD